MLHMYVHKFNKNQMNDVADRTWSRGHLSELQFRQQSHAGPQEPLSGSAITSCSQQSRYLAPSMAFAHDTCWRLTWS
jgi:hypothetical protein